MEIKTFVDNSFGTNNYLLINRETQKAVLVDAGIEPDRIIGALEEDGLNLEGILITHAHPDHIWGASDISEKTGAPVYIHPDELNSSKAIPKTLLRMLGFGKLTIPENIISVNDGDVLEIAGFEFKVLHTPGHSVGSVCYHTDNVLFAGDLVFRGSIGRTDFPGGSMKLLTQSVKEKVFSLPDDTKIYPGHMDSTVVGWEKKTNPFLMGI